MSWLVKWGCLLSYGGVWLDYGLLVALVGQFVVHATLFVALQHNLVGLRSLVALHAQMVALSKILVALQHDLVRLRSFLALAELLVALPRDLVGLRFLCCTP
ncbi:hypothetical protein ACXYMX_14375 [Sporosarcina sp. CAU 1771]